MARLLRLAREFFDLLQLTVFLREERRQIVIYSREASSFSHFEGLIDQLVGRYGYPIAYVTSDPLDPLLREARDGLTVLYIDILAPVLMRLLEAKVLMTTVSDLGKFHVPRPHPETRLVYIFHAVVSTHMMYRLGAFDHYDVIFCVGPHHEDELLRHSEIYGVPQRTLVPLGYPKIDRLAESYQRYTKRHPEVTTVLVASGWGDHNILQDFGEAVIGPLLAAGYRVIVRPHPEMWRRSPQLPQKLSALFGQHPLFTLEPNINSVESLLEADVMVCDWSGVAYEYAFATERPVLSIDLPRKVKNPEWERLGIVPLEDLGRSAIGPIVGLDDLAHLDEQVARLLAEPASYRASIRELRAQYLYNFGHSSEVGAEYIAHLVESSPTREGTRQPT